MSIDNCDLRLWRPARPVIRPASVSRARRSEQDVADAAVTDPDALPDGPEVVAAER